MQSHRCRVAGCLMLGGVLALAAACQGHDGDGVAGPGVASSSSSAHAPMAEGFAITVNNVTRTRRIQRSRLDAQEAAPGDAYVVLDVTISNPGDQTRLFSEGPLIAVDGTRQRRFETPENIIADGYLLLEALAPGATERGRIVYEVPEDLRGNLYWQPAGGKPLLVHARSHAGDRAPRTLAQAPDAGADVVAHADSDLGVGTGTDAAPVARTTAAVAGPVGDDSTPGDEPAASTARGVRDDATRGDVPASRQMRQLACRALVRANAAADRARYLALFNAQCHGFAMPSAWQGERVATRDTRSAPTAPPGTASTPAASRVPAPAVAAATSASAMSAPASASPASTSPASAPVAAPERAPAATLATHDDGGPSFDCTHTITRAQQLVCADALLSLLDRQLADALSSAQREVDDPAALQHDQDDWRQRVRDACQTLNCLERVYTQRTAALRAVGGFADAR